MASVCSFVEEEYIDLDLSSCGEFEFRVRRSGAADELLCRGRLAAAPPRPGGKVQDVDAGCGGAGRRSAARSRRCSTRAPPGSGTRGRPW